MDELGYLIEKLQHSRSSVEQGGGLLHTTEKGNGVITIGKQGNEIYGIQIPQEAMFSTSQTEQCSNGSSLQVVDIKGLKL